MPCFILVYYTNKLLIVPKVDCVSLRECVHFLLLKQSDDIFLFIVKLTIIFELFSEHAGVSGRDSATRLAESAANWSLCGTG